MLFLRSILFSFSILWRYVIVLPLLILALIMFGIAAIFPVFMIGLVAPFFAVLVAGACGAAAGVVPIMVGTRVGLQAKKVRPKNTYFGLILPSIGYGLFEAISVLIVVALGTGAYVLMTPLTGADFMAIDSSDTDAAFALLRETSPVLSWGLVIGGAAVIFALRACLLVPLAGASIGSDPSGRSHTPFYSFGAGFTSLFPLAALSQVGTYLAVPLAVVLAGPLGLADGLAATMAEIDEFDSYSDVTLLFGAEGAMFIGLCVLLFLFFFSLQCAGGVLVYMRHLEAVERANDAYSKSVDEYLDQNEPVQADIDMMDLVRSRMQNK